jgi:hypothetical protein
MTISGDHLVTGKILCDKFSYPTLNSSPYGTVVIDDGKSRFLQGFVAQLQKATFKASL